MKKTLFFLIIFLLTIPTVSEAQTNWINPINHGNSYIHGRYWNELNKDNYNRLPPQAKEIVRPALWNLSLESAGLSIKFKTNSTTIKVRYTVGGKLSMQHMPSTGVSGVDLYRKSNAKNYAWCEGFVSFGDTITSSFNHLNAGGMFEYELYLPLYNSVKWLEIGVSDHAQIEFIESDEANPHIVVYGTSIAQGACASRPGMAWTNILKRKINTPIINLGFSGNGKLEPEFFNLLSEIENASLFIIDCMPNMHTNLQDIQPRMKEGINILRAKTNTPILLVEHCGYSGGLVSATVNDKFKRTNIELKKAYKQAKASGVKNIYYLSIDEINLSNDSQVDGTHASDLGMLEYAKAYQLKINKILHKAGKK